MRNMFNAVFDLSIYSCLCMKMLSFLSVRAWMGNAAKIIFIMLNSISGLDAWYHFQFNISCGVAVKGRGGGGQTNFGWEGHFLRFS